MQAIGKVGASKALHFINPELFVPWDNEIMKYYHGEGGHGDREGGCFALAEALLK